MNEKNQEKINQIKQQYEPLSLDELELHISTLECIYNEKIDLESKRIKNEILETAKKFKITLHVEGGVEVKSSPKSSAKKVKLEPKYKNPKNFEETWSGYGRPPKWLNDYLAQEDHKLEDLLI
ncbi:MAG: H-NS histone family protein [Methylovulum sp.]|nr:H-NS histone family protein [Methylovulum sp.]